MILTFHINNTFEPFVPFISIKGQLLMSFEIISASDEDLRGENFWKTTKRFPSNVRINSFNG